MGKLVSKTELAEILGKSQQTLTTYQKQGMPIYAETARGKSNQYDTEQVIEWLFNQKRVNKQLDLTAERARLAHHQANKTALEEDALKGKLIDAEMVAHLWVARTLRLRAALLSLPTKLASVALAASSLAEVRDYCTKEINAALNELSGNTRPAASESGGGVKATAAPDDKPVGRKAPATKSRGKRRAGPVAQ